jgi:hypothetical protein
LRRTILELMALLVLLALVVGLPGTSPASEQTAPRATLEIVGIEPVAVAGRGFKSGERVRVSADGRRKLVTAGALGGFRVLFLRASACDGLVVVARGAQGSRATVTFENLSNVHCLEP